MDAAVGMRDFRGPEVPGPDSQAIDKAVASMINIMSLDSFISISMSWRRRQGIWSLPDRILEAVAMHIR